MGIPLYGKNICDFKEISYGYRYMYKKHVQIKEAPYVYTFMHKKHVRIKEIGGGYKNG